MMSVSENDKPAGISQVEILTFCLLLFLMCLYTSFSPAPCTDLCWNSHKVSNKLCPMLTPTYKIKMVYGADNFVTH